MEIEKLTRDLASLDQMARASRERLADLADRISKLQRRLGSLLDEPVAAARASSPSSPGPGTSPQ